MAEKAREKRDMWIGHKLGNMTTDVNIGGKESLTDAILIQKTFHEGCVPLINEEYHNFRLSQPEVLMNQRHIHGTSPFINSGGTPAAEAIKYIDKKKFID